MEYRDLYDSKRRPVHKSILKGDSVPEGLYYNTVAVFIENSKGEFLLQKRSLSKGGLFGTTGGHPKSGESSLEGIVCEIKEEIGIIVRECDLTLFKTIKSDDDFVDLYYLKKDIDINSLVLQDEEVADARFFSREEIVDLINNNLLLGSHEEFYIDCLEFLDK